MIPIIGPIFTFFSTIANGIFGWKGEQAKTVQNALDLVKSIDSNDSATLVAQANALSIILTQGSWLERNWRPILMFLLITLIGSWFFGYVPSNFNDPISPMMREVLDLLKIGVMGYLPCRTIEKVIANLNLSSILKQLITKKLL